MNTYQNEFDPQGTDIEFFFVQNPTLPPSSTANVPNMEGDASQTANS